ncbi:VacJ family lipoprotein [Vibrio hannami]|uniref:MlaA family lipoprotein n=1 Tax=Vibrio hannami TaxID=2717094 RepID=UPI00240F258C|nr:VacJ family lipoprotein [Vibrio hannami]MDG3088742.1 VacJ family lipoprotein [Vibrio hannami]
MNSAFGKYILSLLLAGFLVGCSSAPYDEPEQLTNEEVQEDVYDPFEGFNRAMWAFNYDYLDPYLVKPVSLTYVNYTPTFIRSGISNFLSNLDEPASMINDALMGNGELAVTHFNRFWINSTFGILGLFDVAGAAGITKEAEREFSDVAGHYGVGNGPYVMVPGYGPATVRDVADQVDTLYVPLSLLNFWGAVGKWALEGMETRAALVSQEPLLEASPDPYIFTRDAYIQHQDFKAQIESEDYDEEDEALLDEYLDEFE